MLGQDVFSEGELYMDLMLLLRRSPQGKPAIVGQNGAVVAVDLKERIGKENRSKRRRRKRQSTERHLLKYMHLRLLKRKQKVTRMLYFFTELDYPYLAE